MELRVELLTGTFGDTKAFFALVELGTVFPRMHSDPYLHFARSDTLRDSQECPLALLLDKRDTGKHCQLMSWTEN